MNSLKKILFLVVVLTFSVVGYGQVNFKKGYIITNNNDTLRGKINDSGGYKNTRVCLFKAAKSQKVVRYYPEDLKGYRMIGDKYYVSRPFTKHEKTKNIFVDVLVKGEASLYKHRKNQNTRFYIEKEGGELIELGNDRILIRYKPENNTEVVLSPTFSIEGKAYVDTLFSVFRDAERIQDQIESVEYDDFELAKITKAYNAEVCNGKKSNDFERDLDLYRPRFGLFAGVQLRYMTLLPSAKSVYEPEEKSSIPTNSITAFPIGGFVNIPLAKINDRLSLQIELVMNSIKYEQEFTRQQNVNDTVMNINTKTISMPVMLKYEIVKGNISPSIAIGKESGFVYHSNATIDVLKDLKIHPIQKGGWFGEIGINYKLAPKLSVFSNVRFQTNRNMIIEELYQRGGYNSVLNSKHFIKEYRTNYATLLVGLRF